VSRTKLIIPAFAALLTFFAIGAASLLLSRADSSRQEQIAAGVMKLSLSDLQSAPFAVGPTPGGAPSQVLARINADEQSLRRRLTPSADAAVPAALLRKAQMSLATIEPVVMTIYQTSLKPGGLLGERTRVSKLLDELTARSAVLSVLLLQIGRSDADRAGQARGEAEAGVAAALLLLLGAFGYFYFRSMTARAALERLAEKEKGLLGLSRIEARTDPLTGLGNRRGLASGLASAVAAPSQSSEVLLAMFDLDGFKQYNDSFGHAAGDALLERVGGRLGVAASTLGAAYRLGGDEFCIVARCAPEAAERLLEDATEALTVGGEDWRIGCSQGAVWIPSEAATESQALKLADERMYANKAGRSSASSQITDVLLQVVTEQGACDGDHVNRVSQLAGAVAEALHLAAHEVWRIRLAARLHDIGKAAIPRAILDKPRPLDEPERAFIHTHTLIGERIVLAAPALASTAQLIRSSHERIDGGGYPDGLAGDTIPLGSRIIAVCNAFDAMTSERPYRPTRSAGAAIEELERNAGTQFDGAAVGALVEQLRREEAGAEPGVWGVRALGATGAEPDETADVD
jgi:diguanylate cyclase (GGDEF)-like protein